MTDNLGGVGVSSTSVGVGEGGGGRPKFSVVLNPFAGFTYCPHHASRSCPLK